MQEMQAPSGEVVREYFHGKSAIQVTARMAARRAELERYGYKFVGKRKIGRNERCPCGSTKKFKQCCISKIERVIGENYLDVRA